MNSYFDYVEDKNNTLSETKVKAYDDIIFILKKTATEKKYIQSVIKYKNTNDRVFIYYVLYFFLINKEKNIKLNTEETCILIISCINELNDFSYYSKIKELFKIN